MDAMYGYCVNNKKKSCWMNAKDTLRQESLIEIKGIFHLKNGDPTKIEI